MSQSSTFIYVENRCHENCEGSKSSCLACCLEFVRYCTETVCVTQIMRVDLCGISQLLQFLTVKWDIPAQRLIQSSKMEDAIISWPLTNEADQPLGTNG